MQVSQQAAHGMRLASTLLRAQPGCCRYRQDLASPGGMPDLLLWRPATQDAKLSEVKGPRDSLSNQQRAWIAALLAAGLDCEVRTWSLAPYTAAAC